MQFFFCQEFIIFSHKKIVLVNIKGDAHVVITDCNFYRHVQGEKQKEKMGDDTVSQIRFMVCNKICNCFEMYKRNIFF
jgi:hypothetical protein